MRWPGETADTQDTRQQEESLNIPRVRLTGQVASLDKISRILCANYPISGPHARGGHEQDQRRPLPVRAPRPRPRPAPAPPRPRHAAAVRPS